MNSTTTQNSNAAKRAAVIAEIAAAVKAYPAGHPCRPFGF